MMDRSSGSDRATDLENARERLATAERRIEDHGGKAVEPAARAYREALSLLDSYEDRASGTGRETFKAYLELEGRFATLVENLPSNLQGREAFESALEAIDKRRLSESDFERARDALEPAAVYAALLDEREAAENALTDARAAARKRLRELDEAIDEHERLLELGAAPLDAPVDRLRKPIEAYNDAVRSAFDAFIHDASAREIVAFLGRTRWYPFVEYEQSPDEIEVYVTSNRAGTYTIPELLEYATYSRSKLSHYVDDADELKRHIATQRTYLEGIDAEPLTIEWPPPSAPVLRRLTGELIPLVSRVADEDVVAALRSVRELTFKEPFDRLRTAAQAMDQLDETERRRLEDGRVEADLAALEAERERLEAVLEDDGPDV